MSELSENTGQSGPDFTHYNELKQQARTKNDEVRRVVAYEFVPLLYAELIKQHLSPYQAASLIFKDFVPMWAYETVRDLLPDEAVPRDQSRAIGGRASAEVKKQKKFTEKKHKILLKQGAVIEISNASMGSADGSVWEYTNAKDDFVSAEPVTPKSVITEPLAVKTSSAPIHST